MSSASTKFVVLVVCSALGLGLTCAAAQNVENAEVYVVATELADEVELIRELMGRPYDESPRLPVAGVTLFELYFQAQTLLMKSNRLAHELAGAEVITLPVPSDDAIGAAQILPLVERALTDIRRVRRELGITEQVLRVTRETAIAPTGVFSVILDTNRQLDLLLDERISSAEVYARISLALDSAAAILAARGADASLPITAAPGPRRPADVYARLLDCFDLAATIASRADVDVLSMSSRRNIPDDIEPGHVYDVAQLLVADLRLLAQRLGAADTDRARDPMPKHVFPSHNYARADALYAELEKIAATF